MMRKTGGFNISGKPSQPQHEIFSRDATGKPLIVGTRAGNNGVGTLRRCVCVCDANEHDPYVCTGEDDFMIDGRPGSGAVDLKAKEFGMEPTPEMVASMHEEVAALVRVMIAFMEGNTDEQRLAVETELDGPGIGYDDQLKRLRDLLQQRRPDLMTVPPYQDLKPNLKKLAKFRNHKVSHSWPLAGQWLTRGRRVKGQWETFTLTAEEVAEHMDLAFALVSQLAFIPNHVLPPANDDPDAVQRLADKLASGEST